MPAYTPIPNGTSSWGEPLNAILAQFSTAIDAAASDGSAVHLAGAETITGAKTFSASPIVPDSSFTIAKTTGLQAALDAGGGVKKVNTKSPDGTGNVSLTLDDVPDGATRLGYGTAAQTADRSRANHTGTQSSSTIIDFASAARIAAKTGIIAGSGVSVTPGAGETVTIAAVAPPPGSGYARTTIAYTTASLAASAQEAGTIAVGNEYTLSKIQVSAKCRVRVYASVTQRTADAARLVSVDPTGDHGLMFEYVSTGAATYTIPPAIVCANFESSVNAPILIDNIDSSTATITVTFTYKRIE